MNASQKAGNKSFFLSLAGMIQKLCRKIENIPGKVPELVACITYAVAHIFMGFVHEPWYDEAVAWQIARCAPVRDILFEIPHYEGHPPLWHLILAPFAKMGAPYELSLSIVSLIFAGAACCLIIWKSPFPRIIRLLLPFTYFFFYQYSVISRPYCVMMLVFVLLAMAYHKHNEKPGIYVVLLMFLCLTSAYGILIAGGLAIAWILEMWNRQNIFSFIKKMVRDKRTLWLLALLIFALLLIAGIMPREDTFATNNMSGYDTAEGYLRCLLYMLFALPAEVSMTNIYTEYTLLKSIQIPWLSLIMTCLIGLVFWIFVIIWGKRKKTLPVLIVPFVLYAVFAAFVYVYPHHIGIGLYILVFWFWISLKENDASDKQWSLQTKNIITGILVLVGSVAMVISLGWNIVSCIQDVLYSYAIGKNEAEFIKENGLDNYRIMVGWSVYYDGNGDVASIDINHCNKADSIAPYFDRNIFFNFNNGEDALNYSTHKKADDKETEEAIAKWKEQKPDVLFLFPDITMVYEDIKPSQYKLVYSKTSCKPWKGFLEHVESKIYAHEDLIEKLQLETPVNNETYAKMLLY